MITERRNNLFHLCALIEFISRETKNHRGDVVNKIGKEGIAKLLEDAPVNHSLPFEQIASEVIGEYGISNGTFDTISNCSYSIPSYVDIGKLYTYVLEKLNCDAKNDVDTAMSLFSSFLSDEISRFETGFYCENSECLAASYKAGKVML